LNRPPWDINVEVDRKRIRELFASFIGTDSSNIAITPCTAFAITLAARNILVRNSACLDTQRIWNVLVSNRLIFVSSAV
jgi:selenocysteine lyase/cysteine desulfurase